MRKKPPLNRRHFLRTTIFGMLGAGMATKGGWARKKEGTRTHSRDIKSLSPSKIKDYRILGRTGFKVSDLAVGGVQDEGLIGTMLDAGVNYIDTAESYSGHHRIVGNAIKGRDRKSIFIASKMLMEKDTSKEGLVKRVRKALQELNTEYIDCMMMHNARKGRNSKNRGISRRHAAA